MDQIVRRYMISKWVVVFIIFSFLIPEGVLCVQVTTPTKKQAKIMSKPVDGPSIAVNPIAATYTIKPGDRIKITIYPEDKYIKGGDMDISSEGNIALPMVGKISVAGKTVSQAQKDVIKVLQDGYFVEPEVVIEVLKFKDVQVVILGQVKRPGTYSFPPGSNKLTLLQAIALAGGFSDIANIKKIKIVRKQKSGGAKKFNANADSIISGNEEDVELQPGDVVHVPESFF